MSDFYGCLSSSSFRVRDDEQFIADPDVQMIKKHAESRGGFFEENGKFFAFGWEDQYPSTILETGSDGEPEEVDIAGAIQRHILPGDVCQIGISGNEKLRYIGGSLQWVTSEGSVYLDGQTSWEDRVTPMHLRNRADEFAAKVNRLLAREPEMPQGATVAPADGGDK